MVKSNQIQSKSSQIYTRLKREILNGLLKTNRRLITTDIAKEMGTSTTPVRDALNELVSEGLVRRTPSRYYVLTLSAREQTYDELRNKIVRGELKQGMEISIDELAKDSHISKTLIREVLSRLKEKKLVVETKDGTLRVVRLSSETIHQICVVREALEPLALRWGFESIPLDKVRKYLEELNKVKMSLGKGDPTHFRNTDHILHELITNSVKNNPWLVKAVGELRDLTEMMRGISISLHQVHQSWEDHFNITSSILAGKKGVAIKLLCDHLRHIKEHLLPLSQRDQ